MKKILFVITKSNWGGAQRYVYDLATSLPREQFEVAIALGGNGILAEKLKSAGIRLIPIKFLQRDVNIIKEFLSLFSLIQILKREKPDVVHLNSSKIGGLGAVAAKILRIKSVFTVHGWAFNEPRKMRATSIIYAAQWLTAALCNRVIVLSRHDFRQALSMPAIKKEKFSLIPLGISENKYLSKAKARRELGIESNGIVIGTIAELTRNKGLSYLIEAAKDLKEKNRNFKIAIAGDGEDKNMLEHQIAEYGLADHVAPLGFVADAPRYLKAFDIFVLPSLKEGLPYTIIEAMHAGVPVVATSVGGIPDMIEHESRGLMVAPKNSKKLASALETLIHNQKLGARYARTTKKYALEHYVLARMLEQTIALYY